MKKFSFLFLMMIAVSSSLISCKKKKITPDDSDTSLKIEGQWQLKKINFLDERANWDDTVPYTFANYFGFATAMYTEMKGFDFTTSTTTGGKIFNFINANEYNQGDTPYWYWNYTENNTSFEVVQPNADMPPYNFSLKSVSNVVLSTDGNTLTFKAMVYSRLCGKPMAESVLFPVEMTLTKGAPTQAAEVYVQGVKFVIPSENSMINQIIGKDWKLKSGSDLYDPSTTVQEDYDKGYLKVIALELKDTETLRYRYAYPMGVVSPKEYAQTKLNEGILQVKLGGSYNAPEKIFDFKVEAVDLTAGTISLRVNNVVREFVLINDITETIDKNDYTLITE